MAENVFIAENLEEMGTFFNKVADDYNTAHLEHGGCMESKQIIAKFLPEHTKTILDIGIGTGLELASIFERFPNIKVTGLDIAENMLDILKENYPGKEINLHCESYFEYDYARNTYDAVISAMTLHHYTHEAKTELYRKIYGCLAAGGMHIENDYMLSEKVHKNAQEWEDFYFAEYARLKSEQGIGDDKDYHFDTPCTVINQIKMLREAGFTDVKEAWRKENSVVLVAKK